MRIISGCCYVLCCCCFIPWLVFFNPFEQTQRTTLWCSYVLQSWCAWGSSCSQTHQFWVSPNVRIKCPFPLGGCWISWYPRVFFSFFCVRPCHFFGPANQTVRWFPCTQTMMPQWLFRVCACVWSLLRTERSARPSCNCERFCSTAVVHLSTYTSLWKGFTNITTGSLGKTTQPFF